MRYILFKVNSMTIARASSGDKSSPISGSVNYFGVGFEFDEEFSAIAGTKSVEFFKNRETIRRDLADGKCLIPNEMLKDKGQFEMRVISGTSVATPWVSVSVAESGTITQEEPTEDAPENMEYVKTQSGDKALPYMRMGEKGPEFSQDGDNWEGGVSGIPDVPSKKKGMYARVYGDWVPIDDIGGTIQEVSVNGDALEPVDGVVNIDLSGYMKSEEAENSYLKKEDLDNLDVMQGTAGQIVELDAGETDTAAIVAKINEIIEVLAARGVTAT